MMLTFYADQATLTGRQQNSLRAQNTQLLQFHTSKITIASWVFYKTIKLGGREGAWAGDGCNNTMLDNLLVTRRIFIKSRGSLNWREN